MRGYGKKKEKWKWNESTWINLRHKNYRLEIVSLNNLYIKEHKKATSCCHKGKFKFKWYVLGCNCEALSDIEIL